MIKITNKRNVVLSVGVIAISIAGFIHTVAGTWTKYAGEAAKFFPRFVYAMLMISAVALLALDLLGKSVQEPKALADLKWRYVLVYTAAGVVFFLGAYYLGTAVSIFAYLMALMSLFSPTPKKDLVKNAIVAVVATVCIYLIFTTLIPMLTPDQLLF